MLFLAHMKLLINLSPPALTFEPSSNSSKPRTAAATIDSDNDAASDMSFNQFKIERFFVSSARAVHEPHFVLSRSRCHGKRQWVLLRRWLEEEHGQWVNDGGGDDGVLLAKRGKRGAMKIASMVATDMWQRWRRRSGGGK